MTCTIAVVTGLIGVRVYHHGLSRGRVTPQQHSPETCSPPSHFAPMTSQHLPPPPPPEVTTTSLGGVVVRGLVRSLFEGSHRRIVVTPPLVVPRAEAFTSRHIWRVEPPCVQQANSNAHHGARLPEAPVEYVPRDTTALCGQPVGVAWWEAQRELGVANVQCHVCIRFVEFAPEVFRLLRARCGVEDASLYTSLLQSLGVAFDGRIGEGKGGATFFDTSDGKFVFKTITSSECELLLDVLAMYTKHLLRYPSSLLQPLCALVHAKRGSEQLRAVVMPNLFAKGVTRR